MRVAIVYDRLNKIGGAERILQVLHEVWPEAPFFTAVYNQKKALWTQGFKITPSFMQKFPFASEKHEFYPWLTPFAFESFDFSDFELVISVTSAEAKGVITNTKTNHICYCLTPTRYLWSGYKDYIGNAGFNNFNFLVKKIFNLLAPILKKWDYVAAQRPDKFLAISRTTQRRIKKYYNRDSIIVYPPVDIKRFKKKDIANLPSQKDFFLVVSRLVPYKRLDLVIKAFNKLRLPLKIIGVGNQLKRLKRMAKDNIEFLGQLTDDILIGYYQKCCAVVLAQNEDFGLVAIEAQAAGKPVIAFTKGGFGETVIDGKTGILFENQTVEGLVQAVQQFKAKNFKAKDCQQNVKRFNQKVFIKKIKKLVEDI